MKYACLIPARGGSKGIPGKNIKDFCGKPLLVWSIEQARASGCFGDEIYVSTDDLEISDVAAKAGARVIKRPPNLSVDDSPMIAAIQHANLYMNADWITLLQPTNPLRLPKDISDAINAIEGPEGKPVVVCSSYQTTYYKSTEYNPTFGNNRQASQCSYVTGLIYCYSKESLYQWPNRINMKFFDVERWQANELDEPDDWPICEFLFRERILKGC
jgi:CMP-N-acetylneuraminic acid synthetase